MNVISLAFSPMWVWIMRVGSDEASLPKEVRRSEVHEIANRGVNIGCTSWSSLVCDAEFMTFSGGGKDRMWAMRASVLARDSSAEVSM